MFNRRQESLYKMTGLYSDELGGGDDDSSSIDVPPEDSETYATEPEGRPSDYSAADVTDTVIRCHSRQPSSGAAEKSKQRLDENDDDLDSRDCGLLGCRPAAVQSFARIKVKHLECMEKEARLKCIFFRYLFCCCRCW